jgi:uncharacterized peroxidase-related enzyme
MHGLLAFRPAIAPALSALTHTLLCTDEGLSRGERELIGAYVSALNDCFICQNIHGRVAQCHLGVDDAFVEQVQKDFLQSRISDKMKALLTIAGNVQRGGLYVTEAHISTARETGASDLEIHDTVLIAGLFCLFNRYLDGLGVTSEDTSETFLARAKGIVEKGYGA